MKPDRPGPRLPSRLAVLAAVLLLIGCSAQPTRPPMASPGEERSPPADGDVLARNARFVIYRAAAGDTLRSIAARFLDGPQWWWRIADFNQVRRPKAGEVLAVPLQDPNPTGVTAGRFQTVPILCYHRFGPGRGKMIVSADRFAEQMDWLARNDYRVVPLSALEDFLQGRRALPERAVVITIDDGYKTVYQYAYPILRKHGFPATVFLYTDFVGAGDALNWAQMREMVGSGLVDIQAHSKTHSNLIERASGEDDAAYLKRIETEVAVPREVIESKLPIKVGRYAFPYGDANQQVLDRLQADDYRLGLTVNPGGNGFFSEQLMLRRTMIYGDHGLAAFKARLETSRPVSNP